MTSFVGNHGLLAVFILMFVAAILPAASELTMIYGGALASGALAGHIAHFQTGFRAYLAVVVVGVIGNVLGAAAGWAIGYYGGHPLLERHGRWFHATPERLARAERWFDHFGPVAVPLGFATPLIRSFVALPAGILEWPATAAAAPGRAGQLCVLCGRRCDRVGRRLELERCEPRSAVPGHRGRRRSHAPGRVPVTSKTPHG